jgi:trehalose 6-phosphate synthase/phosphatase
VIAASERLLVVSTRLPLTVRRSASSWRAERSSGGLVAALNPLLRGRDSVWLGWPGDGGEAGDPERAALVAGWEHEHGYAAVELPPRLSRGFYEGFSNNTLWPLLHGFPTLATFDAETWQAYRDANERFADAVEARYQPGDLVWVHDYQLLLLPGLVRQRLPDAGIGFFLHVPFPSADVFRALPERGSILRGLLGADLIGFQTHANAHDFRRALLEIIGVGSDMDHVEWDGRTVRLAAHPIGIATDEWERLAARDPAVGRRIRDLRSRNADRRLIVAVDRLDYTKGIPERLRAFRHLLRRAPEWRGRVSLVQVAVPSRERIGSYVELRRQVNELVGEINGEFGTPEWNPVVYLRRSIARSELAALYAAADVAWVGPLRDGMNLVAKEYVACQLDGGGVLILSEFAGAAQEMGEALRVNPYDEVGTSEVVQRALDLPLAERRDRQAALLARIRRSDARAWGGRFVAELREAASARIQADRQALPFPPLRELVSAAMASGLRGLYLDYDGTLVPIADRPADATPTAAQLELIEHLVADAANRVAIVSGRPADELERWFGHLSGLWLAAEHGGLIRDPRIGAWRPLRPEADTGWKARVRPILDDFTDRAPGSLVEEKALGLAWHYRLADPEFGGWLANQLASVLERQLGGTELVVARGRKVIEVRFAWANKGLAIGTIRTAIGRPRFELAIGDDRTDEDLFGRLPQRAWTIRVGPGPSRARYRVSDPEAVLGILGALAELPRDVRASRLGLIAAR